MDHLVAPADHDGVAGRQGRRVVREVPPRVLVAPDQRLRREVDADDLVVVGAEEDLPVVDGRGGDGVGARRQADHLGPVADAHPVEHLVAAAEVGHAVPHRGGRVHVVEGLVLPDQRAVGDVERVEEPVVRADEHAVADDDRRRLDLAEGLERPAGLAGRGVDGVEHAPEVADEHEAAGHRGRRLADAHVAGRVLPALLAGLEVEGDEVARVAADVHGAVGDGRRRVDDVVGLVGPLQRQLGRQLRLGHPAQGRGAPELRPRIGRRGGGRLADGLGRRRSGRQQEDERDHRNEAGCAAHGRSLQCVERWPAGKRRPDAASPPAANLLSYQPPAGPRHRRCAPDSLASRPPRVRSRLASRASRRGWHRRSNGAGFAATAGLAGGWDRLSAAPVFRPSEPQPST